MASSVSNRNFIFHAKKKEKKETKKKQNSIILKTILYFPSQKLKNQHF
jgi:hypothetical protein